MTCVVDPYNVIKENNTNVAHSPTQSKKQAKKKIGEWGGIGVCCGRGDFYLTAPLPPPPPQTFFKGFIRKYIFLNFFNISLEDAVFKSPMHFLFRLGSGKENREDLHKIGGLRSISQLIEWYGKCLLTLTY